MFCSTIIPTVGRDTLEQTVNSVLSQSFDKDDFEIIVVNDSSEPLPRQNWQSASRVRIVDTKCRERSVARNTGAAIAEGRYLHFLDDDDWLFPDALDHFWTLSKKHQASWLYGSTQLVDRSGNELIQLHHGIQGNCFLQTMAGEWIPLQSSLIDTAIFHKLGGFSPLITGPEDIDLLRRVCLNGNIAETPNLIAYVARGDADSTTNYSEHPEMSRWARESILDTQGVFLRMKDGATSGYWFGKMLRIYVTSAIWNLLRRRIFTASSRTLYGLGVILLANYKIFSKGFWGALANTYQSPTFERGFSVLH